MEALMRTVFERENPAELENYTDSCFKWNQKGVESLGI